MIFPDPETADPNGIVAVGGSLSVEALQEAYSRGIFPWPHKGYPLLWFSPDPRAILKFNKLHIPRSLSKLLKKNPFEVTFDQAFQKVIDSCSEVPRPGQHGTWITPEMIRAYKKFHEAGFAHSVEVWAANSAGKRDLVGGLYGVWIGNNFSAESMFHLKPNASKIALLHLIELLKSKGLKWMDIQQLTPHLEKLGAEEIPRRQFLKMLK